MWFAQAVAKTVEVGHRTFIELSPNPAVLISVAGTTFGAGIQNAELIETLRRKEDESFGLINALMKLYVHGHPVNVASLFGVDGADRGYADVPRTRFERKQFWLTASYSASGSGAVPGAHVALPDGRHAWEVNASVVTDPRPLVAAAAGQVWPTSPSEPSKPRTDSRVGHRHHHPQPPPAAHRWPCAPRTARTSGSCSRLRSPLGGTGAGAGGSGVLAGRSVRRQHPRRRRGDHRERGRPVDSGIG